MQNHLDAGATEQRSSEARKTIVIGTSMINTLIKSTLGPFGLTKLLTCDDKIKVTNDGATLLKNLVIDSASARILINASVSQDWEEGDGTTTIAILASLLVEEASKLEEIHPIQIIKGYEMALARALEVLDGVCFVMKDDDMVTLAKTTLNSKILRCDLQRFAEICVNAINLIEERDDLSLINVIKTEGELQHSYLVDGFILDKDVVVPTLKNPRILVANTSMDTDKIKINGAQVNVRSVGELSQIEDAERQRMQEKVEKIVGAENGIDVFVNRQIIYDYFLQLFREKNVVAVEHADFEGVERLANVLGAKIMSTFDSLNDCIGGCERMENVHVGEKVMVKFSGLRKARARSFSKDPPLRSLMRQNAACTMRFVC
ncbi:Chaperonin complex component, TCP-1 beta subunit (CCT2) [Trachipleistophora hominis]|uniref:Chaperonin complex component, TCP-1 beta subunit (CCT2) n=1 Tax=Trachipleistophora hominis TaxID=72359 RepID=L7JST4_TRAHO|nr:Chaperonin complex component, TCP-1 beta subunit (CCT2) [Trachipleistophora hominis]